MRLRYDETPTKVRVQDSIINADLTAALLEDLTKGNSLPSQATSLHAKIMQVEMTLGILTFNSEKKQFNSVQGTMPTSLFAVHSTTGKNTLKCLERVVDSIPGLKDIADDSRWAFSLRHSCTDKYTANFAAERGLSAIWSKQTLVHTTCDIHKLYSSTKSSMSVADPDVSGLLALALGWSESGAVATFKQALCRIFARRLVIYYSAAPTEDADSKASQYQRHLFDLFLPLTGVSPSRAKQHKLRRFVLGRLLNGHLYQKKQVQHYCSYGCCAHAEATLRIFAVYCAWALVPCQAPVFPRSRWTRWDAAIDWAGLIEGCHGLLSQVIAEITGVPTSSQPLPSVELQQQVDQPMLADEAHDEWDAMFVGRMAEPVAQFTPQQQQQPGDSGDVQADEADVGDEPEDWVAKRKQNKKKAALWLQSQPFNRLAIIKPVAALLLSLMYKFLELGGPSFAKKQRLKVAQGRQQEKRFPVLEAAHGRDVQNTLDGLLELMFSEPKAILAENYTGRLKSMRFRMVSAGMTSIHTLLRLPRQHCPFTVFKVLEEGGAKLLLDVPKCMRDSLAHMLLSKYVACQVEYWTRPRP